jgi:hypothetical protein
MSFVFHSDSGHGWLEVNRKLLSELGILEKITPFSYQKGEMVYLEEDCDAGKFIDAYQQKYSVRPEVTEKCVSGSSEIRYYERFRYVE